MRHPAKACSTESTRADNDVELATKVVGPARQAHKLLRGLCVMAAGNSRGFHRLQGAGNSVAGETTFIYCLSGVGWWEGQDRMRTLVRRGDVLVLLPNALQACGPRPSEPWTVQWVRAEGDNLPEFLRELDISSKAPVLHTGEQPHLSRLFAEVFRMLQHEIGFTTLLQASHALGYLLACLIHQRHTTVPNEADTVQKAAQAIIYMSEHLTEPLRVSALARLAGLSAAHFSERFKQETGCSPREYLHLLRIHQACRLLRDSHLSIKEVAAKVGYRDPLHFSRQFKEFQGVSPRNYREGRAA